MYETLCVSLLLIYAAIYSLMKIGSNNSRMEEQEYEKRNR